MRHIQLNYTAIAGAVLLSVFITNTISALPIRASVESVADRLVLEQDIGSNNPGIWPEEAGFTGSIVAGMVDAYELTCNPDYKESAELGGNYMLWSSFGLFFYGDEAYALTRLSDISDDPNNNKWRDALDDFYQFIKTEPDGTEDYIDRFSGTEPSTAVFYLAHNVVAAYYVDANDKEIWRQGLIDWLAQVDDNTASYPVMALGLAAWALAETSPLNETLIDPNGASTLYWDTLIDPCGQGSPYWNKKKLSDLPNLLLTNQVPDGQPHAGSFYWRFEFNANDPNSYAHDIDDPNGYTEDTIFAANGLAAAFDAVMAMQADPNFIDPNIFDPNTFDPNICDPSIFSLRQWDTNVFDPNLIEPALIKAREALINGINPEGKVYDSLYGNDMLLYVYSGEMLQALMALHIPGDIDMDGQVNCGDLEILINNWETSSCEQSCWCESADINRDGVVNMDDLIILVDNWLRGAI